MLRLGTAGPWLLSFLCGLGCGDRVIVARGLSLVSAAQSGGDAGFEELGPAQPDIGLDATDAAADRPADFDAGGPPRHPPTVLPPLPLPRGDGHGAPRDKEQKGEKDEELAQPDAGRASYLDRH